MKNRQGRLAKVVVMLVMGTLTFMAFSSVALAQQAQWMKDAHKMMENGWKQFNDGQRMVIKGKEMNDQVAVQMGFQDKMAQGNKIIQDGRNTATQGATLFAQGEKTFINNLTNPSIAEKGLKMMVDGFHMTKDGSDMMAKGVTMNNQVAQAAGATEKFAQGNQVINTGQNTMASGAKLFLQGETIVLANTK
jgi:hypothetical protein